MQTVFSRQQRWWLALVQVALLLATLVTPAAAATTPAPDTALQLIRLLQTYSIVKGDTQGNLNLDKPISRAELITIMVRAVGGEKDAEFYKNLSFFDDAKGHWAEGYISAAAARKLVKGDGNGHVRPNDYVSYGEALTLILRVIGKEPATGTWPINAIVAAAELGLVPDGVSSTTIQDKAIRGVVFQSLARAITTVKDDQGHTALQTYIDPNPPVITVNQTSPSTKDSSIRVTGTAKDAISVTVNEVSAARSGDTFSADVPLTYGANTLTLTAMDMAGNKAVQTLTITRVPPVSALNIDGPAKVRPNATASFTMTAKDANGNATTLDGVTATVEGNIGTFNIATGILTTAAAPAKGRITLKAGSVTKSIDVEVMGLDASATKLAIRQVNNGLAVASTKPMTVAVEVQNANGQFVDTDYGRPVSLTASGLSGLSVSPATAYTSAGVATFTVTSSTTGAVSLQAASSTLNGAFYTAEFGTTQRIRLSADQPTLTVGSTNTVTRIRATLVDENGNAVANQTANDIMIQLTATASDGNLTDPYLRIIRGASTSTQSGDDGSFTAGAQAGGITISGTVTSGLRMTIDPVSVQTVVPSIGAGSYWDLVTYQPYTPNVLGTAYVRLSDASGVSIPGSYAFQLNIETSNNDPKVNGVPAGVTVTVGNTVLNPVSDGIAEGATNDTGDVIVRTIAGVAPLKIQYNKPGQVYVTVQSVQGTTSAYGQDGITGTAVYAAVPSKTYTLNFTQTPTAVKLVADTDGLGNAAPAGATSPGRTFTLHAYLTDASGNWIPGSTATLTLSKVSGTSTNLPVMTTVTALDGKADFTITSTSTTGEDVYRVSSNLSGNPQSNDITLQVQNAVPAAPSILAVRGTNNGIPGTLNYVAPSDTGLEFELGQDIRQHWVVVRVYPENGWTPIYTSAPIDLTSAAPRITVPKSALLSGVYRYQVTVRNGFGEGPRSLSSNQVTNSVFVSNFTLTSAKYQRATKLLTVYGTGFSNTLDTVNPAKLTIRDASTNQTVNLAGAQVTVNNWNQITINLTGLTTTIGALENSNVFSGSDVTLSADAGWYTRANGEQSTAITPGAVVGPMATLKSVVYDRVNSRLYLTGEGFNSVNIDFTKLKLQANNATDMVLSTFANSRINDNTWMINLTATAITALDTTGAYVLNTTDGWAYDGTWVETAVTNLQVYAQVSLSSVTYTRSTHTLKLLGSGFTGGAITIGNLQLVDKDTNQMVTLSGTVSIVNDGELDFILDSTAYSVVEDTTKFRTTDSSYFIGTAGWFTNAAGRSAAGIPDRTLRLSWQ